MEFYFLTLGGNKHILCIGRNIVGGGQILGDHYIHIHFVFLFFGILVVGSQSFLETLCHLLSVILVHWYMTRSNVC